MTERKLTDEEVIKALECCTIGTFACGKECPYYSIKSNLKVTSCRFELMCELFDLINRQKEKIEELRKGFKVDADYFASEYDSYIRAEAIKEFVERLKNIYTVHDGLHMTIDNLVKEMTEENK